jgi:ABC-type transport system involved in cytochrome bd biosynthesis fused ATPase/permease subunit
MRERRRMKDFKLFLPLSTILDVDTIFVEKNGSIIESGSHHKLLNQNGYYKELYTKQIGSESKKGNLAVG